MDLFNEFFGEPNSQNKLPQLSLFKDDNENGGVFIKANFVTELQAAAKKHASFAIHTKRLIDFMHTKRVFAAEPNQGFEHGIAVIWCRFRYGNVKSTLCVPNITGMADLIDNYQHNRIVVSVTFEELLKQALAKSDSI